MKLIHKTKIFPILFSTLFSLQSFAGIIPVAARYNGAGAVYGAAYETTIKDYKLILGAVTGDANALGGLVTKSIGKDFEISLGALNFQDISLLTTYQRGLENDEDNQYLLSLEGSAFAIGSQAWLFNDLLKFKFSTTKSTIKLGGYQDNSERKIQLPQANLFDIETLSIKLGVDLNFVDSPRAPTKGVKLSTSINQITGRLGQSDQFILDYGTTAIYPITSIFSILGKVNYSSAIVSVNKKYDSDQEIRDQLDANCTSVSNPEEREKCEKLENSLVDYIKKNNTHGTAIPLGGSTGLRSFREQRFKSAHTALYTAEFHTNLSNLLGVMKSKDSSLSLILFYDQGFANDDRLKLFNESKFSNGLTLQLSKGSGAIKLQASSGSDDSNSWSLGFGNAF